MTATRILIVEDEAEIRQFLQGQFQNSGYEVKVLADANTLLSETLAFKPSLILLDQRMPGKSGQDAIRELRGNPLFAKTPIIVVSALAGENEKVAALNIGADDFIQKPFSVRELMARVTALLRRISGGIPENVNLNYKDLTLEPSSYKVSLRGQQVDLTLTEFKILSELLKQSGQVLTRDRLREHALGNLNVSDRTIDVHMAALRRKLTDYGNLIETVRGVGYRMS